MTSHQIKTSLRPARSRPQNIQILSVDEFRHVPWKNGGGVTVELIAEKSASDGELNWRLSIADIDEDGPFSDFSGYDRTLVLLRGNGVTLRHSNKQVDRLANRFSTAIFPGEADTHATLHDGPVQDFNLIVRRGVCRAEVCIAEGPGPTEVRVDANVLLAYAVEEAATLTTPDREHVELARGCLLKANDATPGPWQIQGGSTIVIQVRMP